ncbi:DUF2612 domain-containing protein [Kaistia dalseonensis]|uniref:DUF2612 domain-containing protein n=1 Tax=Kaistia dalseonensis TaxID=410840 RepID=A0ABU0H6L3_9HYPH|nr:DUF2612 domain-containing protein [Kaistia dalseonensis]MCX5495357.1 DUF2612 domain-containing protein [Kaistia dalseonensis]MDQ0437943.1 hypothetical protein [Kaistia dalseonensis]
MATSEDYVGLITSYHRGKPKFTATIEVSADASVAQQDMIRSIVEAFDLDVSIGAQLDVDGEWIGRNRYISTPLDNVWFSWDTAGLGWEQGVWKGPYDSTTGLTRLDDETYRLLLRAKIAANSWDGTVDGAQNALDYIFADTGTIVFVEDPQDMTMTVGIAGVIPSALFLSILIGGYIPLKPAGVKVNYYLTSVMGDPIFGFDVPSEDGVPIAGWDEAAWAVSPEYALTHDLVP